MNTPHTTLLCLGLTRGSAHLLATHTFHVCTGGHRTQWMTGSGECVDSTGPSTGGYGRERKRESERESELVRDSMGPSTAVYLARELERGTDSTGPSAAHARDRETAEREREPRVRERAKRETESQSAAHAPRRWGSVRVRPSVTLGSRTP